MRYLLILTLCLSLSACSKNTESPASEAELAEEKPEDAKSPSPSEAVHPLVTLEGWTGPAAELSDATEQGLSRCTSIHMVLPSTEQAPLPTEEIELLKSLFSKLLTQWDEEKTLLEDSCEQAFGDRPVLSQCSFETVLAAVPSPGMTEEEQAFVKEYATTGKVLVEYRYYNPRTAIDDPLFERQCEQLRGEWEAVSVDSPEYQKAAKRYAAEAGSTAAAQPGKD